MRALLIAALLATTACDEPPPTVVHKVRFLVSADDGERLPGARLSAGERVLGDTGSDGTLLVEIRAPEGTRLPVEVTCPDEAESPPITTVGLRSHERLDAKSGEAAEVSLTCTRKTRLAAVAVRAQSGPNLPVILLGREVARTDASGIAHALLRFPPGTTFRLTLDTTGDPTLRPRSPSQTFVVSEADDVLLFDQPFERPAPPPKRRAKAAPPPPPPDRPFAIK